MSDASPSAPDTSLAQDVGLLGLEVVPDDEAMFREHTNAESPLRSAAAQFQSILFVHARPGNGLVRAEPGYFSDLNLDQLFESIASKREEYDLIPFFYEHLPDVETISYRQDVFRDLEHEKVFEAITAFAKHMQEVRASLRQANQLHYIHQRQSWFADTVEAYCDGVASLARELTQLELGSEGLKQLREYLSSYVNSPGFIALLRETEQVKEALSTVEYAIHIKMPRVTVKRFEGEADYSADVLATFERFKQGAVHDYRVGFRNPPELNQVEANVLSLVARLYPEVFATLDGYYTAHQDYFDPTIRRFDREAQFYISYLEHLQPLKDAGLPFCYPAVARETKEVFAEQTFDLALADKLIEDKSRVVTNDFFLTGPERILVVSGPNQGGKTTFARTFGQLHHLAGIGYPVPGQNAQLYLYDKMFVQFEREEDLTNMTGKLEDDLLRIRQILSEATTDSIVVLNELFASTTLQDSVFLGKKVMDKLIELDLLAVFVTFVEELASLGPSTVSMASTIVPDNPAERTFKVVRKPADGLAFALAIAEKYGVTYEQLKRRLSS